MKFGLRILILFGVLFCLGVYACRYSVRDTGFVDLGDAPYQLVLSGNNSPERVEAFRGICSSSLLDANITFVVGEPSDQKVPSLTLEDGNGRSLLLSAGDEMPSSDSEIGDLIESVALSPLRARIHETALDAFAVVVFIEGADAEYNLRARSLIEAAIRNVARIMPSMPKPVDTPPAIIAVSRQQAATERVTLWGLGIDPLPRDEPRVAIMMGRGRRIGAPLEGPLLTQTVVQDRLAIIGQDCECELDRAWMKGPLMPARWDAGRQREAVQKLGFDPENPLVRAEVSRIVLRGPGERQLKKLAGGSSVLGYSEVMLDDLPMDAPVETVDVAEPTRSESDATEPGATEPDAEPAPMPSQAVVDPLDRGREIGWAALVGGGVVVLLLAGLWWRRIRRNLG